MGRLIPAGTGMPTYRNVFIEKDEPVKVEPTFDELIREAEEDEAMLADFDDEQ